jgi:hypothetical protein
LLHCSLTYRHHHPFVADLVSRTATFLDCINGPLVHLTGGLFFIEKQMPTGIVKWFDLGIGYGPHSTR